MQSRYYDPAIGRFLNADDIDYLGANDSLLSFNLFAYCQGNPINSTDPLGTVAISAFAGAVVGGAIAGALISTVSYTVTSGLSGESITKEGLINSAVSGAASGAIGGAIGTISVGAKAVSLIQKAIPFASEKTLTIGTKAIASLAVGSLMSNNQTQQGIAVTSTTMSTFLGSMIDATTNNFASSVFCNYAATLFVGTAVEVATVLSKQFICNR